MFNYYILCLLYVHKESRCFAMLCMTDANNMNRS
ncbi:Uncharacterised protein [Bacteroides uniformis]|nr:Uncharacterised protein [Bacteroides uniformis]